MRTELSLQSVAAHKTNFPVSSTNARSAHRGLRGYLAGRGESRFSQHPLGLFSCRTVSAWSQPMVERSEHWRGRLRRARSTHSCVWTAQTPRAPTTLKSEPRHWREVSPFGGQERGASLASERYNFLGLFFAFCR